jgi:uncharacterized protein with beta-barrel porin domain
MLRSGAILSNQSAAIQSTGRLMVGGRGASLDVYEAGGVAAGTGYLRIALTNLSGETCRLSGIPTVVAVDTAGRPIGAPAAKSGLRITLPHSSHPQVLPMPNRRRPHQTRGGGQLSVGRIE